MKNKLIVSSLLMFTSMVGISAHASLATKVQANYVKSDYAKTKYPLVFTHGMAGFSRLGNDLLGIDYWYQITPDLARNGGNVWTTRVSPFNSSEVRGEQLVQQIDEIIAITGQPKVNLIGHSHGGPTIRYAGGVIPEKIASMTAVGSPNKGSPVADLILKAEGTPLEGPLVAVVNLLSGAIVWAQGQDQSALPSDSLAGGNSLTTTGSAKFNQKFPSGIPTTACGEGAYQDKGMQMYSFTGDRKLTNIFDLDSFLVATGLLINGASDGLVPVCSAHFGKTIRDNYSWNHFDEVNLVLGLRGLFSQDPVQIYREHANRLKNQGL